MNSCCFTGYLVENPKAEYHGNILRVEFTMVSYSYRMIKKTGEKSRIPTYLLCEAWHTGAETIEKLATKGTKIAIQASAKHFSGNDDYLIFRVNEFDILNEENTREEW